MVNLIAKQSNEEAMKVSFYIAQLYHHSQGSSEDEFKTWCFKNLQKIISFDSASWLIDSNLDVIPAKIKQVYTYNLQRSFFKNYAKVLVKHKSDSILQKAINYMNRSVIYPFSSDEQDVFQHSIIYKAHYKKYNQEHSLITISQNEAQNISHVISLYRRDKLDFFTQENNDLKSFILPHLIEAFSLNQLSVMKQRRKNPRSYWAVCDRQLNIIEAEDNFFHLLDHFIGNSWNRKQLPISITSNFLAKEVSLNELIFEINDFKGMYYVEVYYNNPLLSSLTKKESEILNLLLQYFSNNDISDRLNIASKTLNNHLGKIYLKLGVKSKNEVVSCISSFPALS